MYRPSFYGRHFFIHDDLTQTNGPISIRIKSKTILINKKKTECQKIELKTENLFIRLGYNFFCILAFSKLQPLNLAAKNILPASNNDLQKNIKCDRYKPGQGNPGRHHF